MITLLLLTDGRRDCIERTIASAKASLIGQIAHGVIWDDSGDEDHHRWLRRFERCGFTVVRGPWRSGASGGIGAAWAWLGKHDAEPFVFHLEDDFMFNRPVPLMALALTLSTRPQLAQLALRRHPWDDDGRMAGAVDEQHPGACVEIRDHAGNAWLEHRRFFTTDPCLYRRDLMDVGWPRGPHGRSHLGCMLRERGLPWGVGGDEVRFGVWGAHDSGVAVEHIGHERPASVLISAATAG